MELVILMKNMEEWHPLPIWPQCRLLKDLASQVSHVDETLLCLENTKEVLSNLPFNYLLRHPSMHSTKLSSFICSA